MAGSARQRLDAYAKEWGIDLIFFDPPHHFDDAILGLVHGCGQAPVVLYDEQLVLAAMVNSGMSPEDAIEWFEFNTIGGWHGAATPRFLLRPHQEDET